MTHMVNANEIALYAQNTGEFYETHCKLAREEIAQGERAATASFHVRWSNHVSNSVLPFYKHEVNAGAVATRGVRQSAAHLLRIYYLNHVRELIALEQGSK